MYGMLCMVDGQERCFCGTAGPRSVLPFSNRGAFGMLRASSRSPQPGGRCGSPPGRGQGGGSRADDGG